MTDLRASPVLGVVVIGRNEGARLGRCLASVRVAGNVPIVYVDSGSSDGSPALAREHGAEVVILERGAGFSMARGRNAGFERLLALWPTVELVQFLDGDCELALGWLERARREMAEQPDAAVVSGRRRERRRQANIYHRLMDMEWDTPVGEVEACHGDAVMRVAALRRVGLFDERLIAGEEPELCVRLRAAGRRVLRVAAEMSKHDAAITSFEEWWRRCVRSGHAYAQGVERHGLGYDPSARRQLLRPWLWLLGVPLAVLAALPLLGAWAFAGLLVYPLHAAKVLLARWRRGDSLPDAALYAVFNAIGRVPALLGQAGFWIAHLRGRSSSLIEYKRDARGAP